ncbi:MAG TPA: hypothetical protein VMV09_06640 [Candidatus Saccharimonadales bacterium]|nr:hypothetical protein [Candidatus Saccharimonadales bacterium]
MSSSAEFGSEYLRTLKEFAAAAASTKALVEQLNRSNPIHTILAEAASSKALVAQLSQPGSIQKILVEASETRRPIQQLAELAKQRRPVLSSPEFATAAEFVGQMAPSQAAVGPSEDIGAPNAFEGVSSLPSFSEVTESAVSDAVFSEFVTDLVDRDLEVTSTKELSGKDVERIFQVWGISWVAGVTVVAGVAFHQVMICLVVLAAISQVSGLSIKSLLEPERPEREKE